MAQARLEVKATADVSQATRELKKLAVQGVSVIDEIRAKNQEGIKAVIGMFSPMAIIGQALAQQLSKAIDWAVEFARRVSNAKQAYAELGKEVDKTAKNLGTSTEQAVRLEAAAKAAGVGAKEYAQTMEDIKSGKTTLEEQAEAWERIAGATKTIGAQKEVLAGMIANEQQRREERIGAAERAGALLSGLGEAGEMAQYFYSQILNGRRTLITPAEYNSEAVRLTFGKYTGLDNPEDMDTVLKVLNGMIYDRIVGEETARRESERREQEKADAQDAEKEKAYREQRAAVNAQAEKEEKERNDYVRGVYDYAQKLMDAGLTLQQAIDAITKTDRKSADFVWSAYSLGERNFMLSREGVLRQAQAEQAKAKETAKATAKAQQEAAASNDKFWSLIEWFREARAEALGSYAGGYANGFGLVAGAGDLIGPGRYRAVTRMTEAQRLLKVNEELLKVNRRTPDYSSRRRGDASKCATMYTHGATTLGAREAPKSDGE